MIALAILAIAAAFAGWAAYPRHPNLAAFDPEALARTDTALWRAYYDKRYFALLGDLYSLSRDRYGFSPLDSLRIALAAARAAKTFQPTRSRAEAQAALPDLIAFYRLIAKATPTAFDIDAAARAELDWWQARRENVTADAYGLTIAKTSALVYGKDNAQLREAGVLRAKAMAYRDAHGTAMTEAEWNAVYEQLRASYLALKRGIEAR
jgi:hypothetical protein